MTLILYRSFFWSRGLIVLVSPIHRWSECPHKNRNLARPRVCSVVRAGDWKSSCRKFCYCAVNMHPEGFRYDRVFFMSEGFVWKVLFLSFFRRRMSISLCRFAVSAFQWNVSKQIAIIPITRAWKGWYSVFSNLPGINNCASNFINNSGHFLIHNIGQGHGMNIIEEQNMIDETKQPLKANTEATNVPPSAKKVYSKPTLVVLSQKHDTNNKAIPRQTEGARPPSLFVSGPS